MLCDCGQGGGLGASKEEEKAEKKRLKRQVIPSGFPEFVTVKCEVVWV